jgi:hypothetical protein
MSKKKNSLHSDSGKNIFEKRDACELFCRLHEKINISANTCSGVWVGRRKICMRELD